MADQMIFKRYEMKYAMDSETMMAVEEEMATYTEADPHGHSRIQSLYFDTPNYILARRSLEHPLYKEKLRLRSYGIAKVGSPTFLELKKKYESVVYKRWVTMEEDVSATYLRLAARENLTAEEELAKKVLLESFEGRDGQIMREIDYSFSRYPGLAPRKLLMYDRDAFYAKDDHEFRVTFDSNILWRNTDLDLTCGFYGERLVPQDRVLMEVKAGGAIPLYFVKILKKYNLNRTSFSKYGRAYQVDDERDKGWERVRREAGIHKANDRRSSYPKWQPRDQPL